MDSFKFLVIVSAYYWKQLSGAGGYIFRSGGNTAMIFKGAASLAYLIGIVLFFGWLFVRGFLTDMKLHIAISVLLAILFAVSAFIQIPASPGS